MLSRRLAGVWGVACLLIVASPASGLASSLPTVTSGVRPGPAILYALPANAPQLTNAPGSGWNSPPILISGAHEYDDGEYVYQGYLFDDHGAAGVPDPNSGYLNSFLFAAAAGTLTYPTGPATTTMPRTCSSSGFAPTKPRPSFASR